MSASKPEKFRETLWFKKGELDADQAAAAAQSADDLAPAAADLLPLEDRYTDDGTVTATDRALYGVHTGVTQAVEQIPIADEPPLMPDHEIVSEMKRGRRPYIALGAAALAAIAALVVTVAA
jgi:hypothetical protein